MAVLESDTGRTRTARELAEATGEITLATVRRKLKRRAEKGHIARIRPHEVHSSALEPRTKHLTTSQNPYTRPWDKPLSRVSDPVHWSYLDLRVALL
jgi:hypothetical protein